MASQEKELGHYYFDDGLIRRLSVTDSDKRIQMIIDAPISAMHKDYGGLLKRFLRRMSSSAYLDSDFRRVEIVFSGCGISTKSEFDDSDRDSRISNIRISEKGQHSVFLEADEIELEFEYGNLEIREL
jgi:hypothetical protein